MMVVKMKSGVEFHAGKRFPDSTMSSSCYDFVVMRTDTAGRVEKSFYFTGWKRCRARAFEMVRQWERDFGDMVVQVTTHTK